MNKGPERKLQIVSDVHLEFRRKNELPVIVPCADYLALLGDIGKPLTDAYRQFLTAQSAQFKEVFVLMGNHEFYNASKSVDAILQAAQEACAGLPNVHLLERDTFSIHDVTILGCTLWSNISMEDATMLNDFQKIHSGVTTGEGWTHRRKLAPEMYLQWHRRDLEWIQKTLESIKEDGGQAIVLTHHGPLPAMSGDFVGCEGTSAFVNDLSHLFKAPIIAWASGHVHSNVDIHINGIRSVSNAMGYPEEDSGTVRYNPGCVIDF